MAGCVVPTTSEGPPVVNQHLIPTASLRLKMRSALEQISRTYHPIRVCLSARQRSGERSLSSQISEACSGLILDSHSSTWIWTELTYKWWGGKLRTRIS